MEHGNGASDTLHTLIPLADFKAILGIDDRENALSRYCLITATYSIEQYCKRRFFRKKHTDYLTFTGDHIFSLREYPVRRVLAVNTAIVGAALCGEARFGPENLVDPKHYYCLPDEGIYEDIPFSLVLRPPFRLDREERGIKVRYLAGPENSTVNGDFFWPHAVPHYSSTRSMFRVHYLAGYAPGKAPPDLASACLELAAWNMSRYRGPPPRSGFFIGMTGNVRGSGKDGEHLESSMPENVRLLLEPYKRRTI